MCIVILFALSTFGLPEPDAGTNLSIIGSLVLACIAIRFVISRDTPRVPYMTSIDREAVTTLLYLLVMAYLNTEFSSFLADDSKLDVALLGGGVVLIVILAPMLAYAIKRFKSA